ncbi:MAG: hypothetical protein ABSH22_08465 [Tepidisphaeraceae bacterium]
MDPQISMLASLTVSHPIALLALLAWGALVIYLLTGRRRVVMVPFLPLWPASSGLSDQRESWQWPPLAVAAALGAALLAIVAAAGPTRYGTGTSRPVVVILDRGATMSARQGDGRRFQAIVATVSDRLTALLGTGSADLIVIPSGERETIDRGDLSRLVSQIGPTAVDTRAAIADAVKGALGNSRAVVLLFSDQKIAISDDRLVQIAPTGKIENVGIAGFSVRAAPVAQAMVRVVNQSPATQAVLHVGAADAVSIVLPATGTAADYFVNLPDAADVVEATIGPGGDIDADDHAWAVRGEGWPKLTQATPLPAELERMVEVYGRHRPTGEDARIVTVTSLESPAPVGQIAAEVLSDDVVNTPAPSGAAQWQPHPITEGIDFNTGMAGAQLAQAPPAGFHTLVSVAGRATVAVRDEPARQVWVGFRSADWAATPGFVVFWTKVFDWLGEGDASYRWVTVGQLGADWQPVDSGDPVTRGSGFAPNNGLWPGQYRRGSDTVAVNAPLISIDPADAGDWESKVAVVANEQATGVADATVPLVLAAIVLCLLAAIFWPQFKGGPTIT